MKRCVCIVAIFAIVAGNLLIPSFSNAHGVFKKALEDKYTTDANKLLVTCNACHVKAEPKDVRNDLGQRFAKEFEGLDLSAGWEKLETDLEARDNYEQTVMVPAFVKAFEKIGEQELKEGSGKIKDLFAEGKIEGTKMKAIKK